MKVRLAVPSKGRLRRPSLLILERAGLVPVLEKERALTAKTTDPDVELIFLRAADIPKFVQEGSADLGITGYDFVVESKADVKELLDLKFGKAKIVLAASEDSGIKSIPDIKPSERIATKFVNLTRSYFEQKGKDVSIIRMSGATEVVPSLGIANLIVDTLSTGTTLSAHRLKVIDIILESSARLIANKQSLAKKRAKISEIVLALESTLLAEERKLLMMNVPEASLKSVIRILPAMAGPTIAKVEAPEPMWEIYSVVDEKDVYKVISRVKKAGARDILVIPIERIVR